MNPETLTNLREKLDAFGLPTFIKECRFILCRRTINPNQLAIFLELDHHEIVAAVGPFSKNCILYDLVHAAISSAERFLEAMRETGNEHIILDVVKEKFELSSPRINPNATIIVTLEDKRSEFPVNTHVLAERSLELRKRLMETGAESDKNEEIRLVDKNGKPLYYFNDVHPASFQIILDSFSTNILAVGTINVDNACRIFHDARKLGVWQMEKAALDFIAKEAEIILDDVKYFTADDWAEILRRNNLRVPSEIFLFQKVQKWIVENDKEGHEHEVKKIMKHIRFLQMTAEELIFQVRPAKIVQEEFLCDLALQVLGFQKRRQKGVFNGPRQYRASAKDPAGSNDTSEHQTDVTKTQEYLKMGDSQIKLDPEHRKVVLVLGKTGVGKTTLCQILSGKIENLESTETEFGLGTKFIIKDKNDKIGTSSTISQTTYPELMITNQSSNGQISLYDCPGFEDTRSVALEIANSFFIKRVADFAQGVKILLVINASSFHPGNKKDFPDFIKQTLGFIKTIKNYQNGVALLVNMVDSSDSNDQILGRLSKFLINVEQEIDKSDWSVDFKSRARQLINSLQSKIQIFRCPLEEGPLTALEEVCSARDSLLEFLMRLDFVPSSDGDFGHSLSPEALLIRTSLLDRVKHEIRERVEEIAQLLKKIYTKHIIKLVDFLDDVIFDPERIPKEDVADKLVSFKSLMLNLSTLEQRFAPSVFQNVQDIPNFIKNLQPLVEETGDAVFQVCQTQLRALQHHENTWKFLLQFGEQPSAPDFVSLGQPLISLNSFFQFIFPLSNQNCERMVFKFLDQLNRDISTAMTFLVKELTDFYKTTFFLGSGIGSKLKHLDLVSSKMERQFSYWHQVNGNLNLCKEILELSIAIESALEDVPDLNEARCLGNVNIYSSILHQREYHRKLLQNLLESSSIQVKGTPEIWIQPFGTSVLLNFLEESCLWYEFLKNLQIVLSTYQVQKKINEIDRQTVEELKTLSKVGGFITNGTLNNLTSRLRSDPFNISITVPSGLLPDIYSIKIDPVDDVRRYGELCQLLDGILSHRANIQLEGGDKLVIKGRFIVLSQTLDCQGKWDENIKAVEIYASDTIFIDCDLDARGRNLCLSISSPTWNIVGGPKKFLLDGAAGANGGDGAPSTPMPIPLNPDYYFEGPRKRVRPVSAGDGKDGQPGQPGTSGGCFTGVGLQFINSENLEISACGGQGGRGGDGSAGQSGINGVDAAKPIDGTNDDQLRQCVYGYQETVPSERIGLGMDGSLHKAYYRIFGQPSILHGGNGGNGGKGGEGGLSGTISIIFDKNLLEPESQSQINIKMLPGERGQGGKGGAPGGGGQGGKSLFVRYERRKTKEWWGSVDETFYTWFPERFEDCDAAGNSPQGLDGADDSNCVGILNPMPSSWKATLCSRVMFANFVTFLTENMNSQIGFWLTICNLTIEECIEKIWNISGLI